MLDIVFDPKFILTGLAGLLILGLGELLWRDKTKHGEGSRKFTHIIIGSFIAMWPFYLSWPQIRLISIVLLAGVFISKYLRLFRTVHSVERTTWGEAFFALSVGLLTFVTVNKYIYAAALLHMSLADGLAATIGVKFGRSNSYRLFKHTKSLVGTATFVAVSLFILAGYHFTSGYAYGPEYVAITLGAALLENVAVYGLDNLLVPIYVAILLNVSSMAIQ